MDMLADARRNGLYFRCSLDGRGAWVQSRIELIARPGRADAAQMCEYREPVPMPGKLYPPAYARKPNIN